MLGYDTKKKKSFQRKAAENRMADLVQSHRNTKACDCPSVAYFMYMLVMKITSVRVVSREIIKPLDIGSFCSFFTWLSPRKYINYTLYTQVAEKERKDVGVLTKPVRKSRWTGCFTVSRSRCSQDPVHARLLLSST